MVGKLEIQSTMSELSCGGCHEDVGPVHACSICSAYMHRWRGMPQGDEGFGQPVLCPSCEQLQTAAVIDYASPMIAAFEGSDCDSASSHDAKSDRLAAPKCQKERQSVSTIHNRRRAVRWMESKFADGAKTLFATTVDAFTDVFNSSSRQSDLRKAVRWWKAREILLSSPRGSITVSKVMQNGRQLIISKALSGCGRKWSHWVTWMYPRVRSEFVDCARPGSSLIHLFCAKLQSKF
ncbi:unnamed protein product [Hyaloperonospora brassicae]|uniref:Zinc finger PHD-type domain-containing protein n=1 Tax=Hyaloperonospora brassicae TaxID=162125 RepID=A0AAV0UXF1_HYABA|nr:unnamed protein product [Hyaloperonospora brassicae]